MGRRVHPQKRSMSCDQENFPKDGSQAVKHFLFKLTAAISNSHFWNIRKETYEREFYRQEITAEDYQAFWLSLASSQLILGLFSILFPSLLFSKVVFYFSFFPFIFLFSGSQLSHLLPVPLENYFFTFKHVWYR